MRHARILGAATLLTLVSSTQVRAQTAPPTVTLTQPGGSPVVLSGANLMLSANASATAPATIATVYFYQGSTVIARFHSAPYAVIWSPQAAGSYSVYAVATDSNGVAATTPAVPVTVTAAPPPIVAAPGCPSGATPGADLTQLSDAFTGSALSNCWNIIYPGIATITQTPGSLSVMMTSGNMWWWSTLAGEFIYKDVAGNFKVTAAVHVRHARNPPNTTGAESLGGLMAANPTGLGDMSSFNNYVFNHVGFEGSRSTVETKSTVNSASTWTNPTWTSNDAELRICRVGSTFYNYHRAIGATAWILESSYVRSDLPNVLHVGMEQCATPQVPDHLAIYDYIRYAGVASVSDCIVDP